MNLLILRTNEQTKVKELMKPNIYCVKQEEELD